MYLMVPRLRNSGYIPFFVSPRKRSEAALVSVVCDCFVNGVSTRRIDKLAHSLGIENISRSQVSQITKGLDKQVNEFQERSLAGSAYPVLWVDALYEKVRYDGHVQSMAIMIVCGVSSEGRREILSVMPMLSESKENYNQLFRQLIERGLKSPALVVSDANKGLVAAIKESFPGASWQRCKVHFMRNILVHVTQREKPYFAARLKEIWSAPNVVIARQRAKELIELYKKRFPKAIEILEDGLEDALVVFSFPGLEPKKISSTNMIERLNREIRRRSAAVGIFPNPESYTRLVTTHLIEYEEDWSSIPAYLNPKYLQTLV